MIDIETKGSELDNNATPEECFRFYHDHKQDRNELVRTLALFANYTGNAKAARLKGDIRQATRHENEAQALYESLPQVYRW